MHIPIYAFVNICLDVNYGDAMYITAIQGDVIELEGWSGEYREYPRYQILLRQCVYNLNPPMKASNPIHGISVYNRQCMSSIDNSS